MINNRAIISLVFLLLTVGSFPQFSTNDVSIKATQLGESISNIDEIIILNGIKATTSVSYIHSSTTNFRWYRYLNSPSTKDLLLTENNVSTTSLNIYSNSVSIGYIGNGDGCGYILEYDEGLTTKQKCIWVFDVLNYSITLSSLLADTIGTDPCSNTHITAVISESENTYEYIDSLGNPNSIPRRYTLTYNTLDSLNSPVDITYEKSNFIQGTNEFVVISPLAKSIFKLTGDQFFEEFGIEKEVSSPEFTPLRYNQI